MPSFVNIATDQAIIELFCKTAPIVTEQAQFARSMNSEAGRYDLAQALLYFALGYRACEHVQNHAEHLSMLDDAADPEHPQLAVPGFDFSVENVLANLEKQAKQNR